MELLDLLSAMKNHRIITETKRGGQYRILEISKEGCKQQDGSWVQTAKYEDISSLISYRRPVNMFQKFSEA